jgi:hypothetical protein
MNGVPNWDPPSSEMFGSYTLTSQDDLHYPRVWIDFLSGLTRFCFSKFFSDLIDIDT